MKASAEFLQQFEVAIAEADERDEDRVIDEFANRLLRMQPIEVGPPDEDKAGERPWWRQGLPGAVALLRSARPVAPEIYAERIATCLSCPDARVFDLGATDQTAIVQCRLCSCVMNAKARMRGGVCQVGRFAR